MDADTAGFKPMRGGVRDVGGKLSLRIFGLTKTVIAAINGTAVGIGVTMTLPMDVRIAAEGARFVTPGWLTGFLARRHPGVVVEQIEGLSATQGAATRLRLGVRYAEGRDGGLPAVLSSKEL